MKNTFEEEEEDETKKSLKSFNAHDFYSSVLAVSFFLSHRAIQNDKCRIKKCYFHSNFTYKDVYTDG